jgi:trans-2,3-dihydro-3-hydroxyanthranilate isomerase
VLAAILGLAADEILESDADAPCIYSAGVPFTCVPVRDLDSLGRATPDVARWKEWLAQTVAPDLYVFCHESAIAGSNVQVRMFAPAMGIIEDPATGAAAAAFGGYLWKRNRGPGEWVISQGVEMGRPSKLHVQAIGTGERVEAVKVGGSAVRVSSGTMRIP